MATITKPTTFSTGAVILASEHNNNFDTIYNDHNGGITKVNIKAGAGIEDTKLATIETSQKVNLTALVATSQAQGDTIHASGATTFVRLAKGTDGQYYKMGASNVPEWVTDTVDDGFVVGYDYVESNANTAASTSAVSDDTIPLIAELNATPLTITMTPESADNILIVEANVNMQADSNNGLVVGIFKDAGGACLCAVNAHRGTTSYSNTLPNLKFHVTGDGVASRTYTVYIGGTDTAALMNGFGTSARMGAAAIAWMSVTEIKGS